MLLQPSRFGGGAKAVKSIEYLTVTFANADDTKTINLTKGQNQTKCVPFMSARIASTLVDFGQLSMDQHGITAEIYDNGGTAALRLQRYTTYRSVVCHVYIVEFNTGVTVTRGSTTLTTDGTVAISAVTLAKSFLVFTTRGGSADRDPRDAFVRGRFNSTTQLGFNRNNDLAGPNGTLNIWYYIVQDTAGNLFDVKTAEASMGSGVTTANTAISSVNMAKSMVVASADGASFTMGLDSEGFAYLESSTNVRFVRTNSNTNTDLHTAFVVTFLDGTTVQRGIRTTNTGTPGDSDASETVAITTVDTTKSIAKWTMASRSLRSGRNTIYNGSNTHTIEVTSGGATITIRYRASGAASACEAAWEVVTFDI